MRYRFEMLYAFADIFSLLEKKLKIFTTIAQGELSVTFFLC